MAVGQPSRSEAVFRPRDGVSSGDDRSPNVPIGCKRHGGFEDDVAGDRHARRLPTVGVHVVEQPSRENDQSRSARQYREGRAEETFEAGHRPPSVSRINEREQSRSRIRRFVRVPRVGVVHRRPMHFRMIVRDCIAPFRITIAQACTPMRMVGNPCPSFFARSSTVSRTRVTMHWRRVRKHGSGRTADSASATRRRCCGARREGSGFCDEALSQIAIDHFHGGEVIHGNRGGEEREPSTRRTTR